MIQYVEPEALKLVDEKPDTRQESRWGDASCCVLSIAAGLAGWALFLWAMYGIPQLR